MLGKWKSKESGFIAIVEKIDDENVWYQIPEFRCLCPYPKQLWPEIMERADG